MFYDQEQLHSAVETGERRLAERKQRLRQQRRRTNLALGVFGLALLALVCIKALWPVAPNPPQLVVTWPKDKAFQVVGDGQTILARDGQPFKVALANPASWDVAWRSNAIESTGDAFEWAPQSDGDTLVAACRVRPSGLRALWAKPSAPQTLSLRATLPASSQIYTRTLSSPSGFVWLFPFIEAKGNVSWDERALAGLFDAVQPLPEAKTLSGHESPVLWHIVSDFDGKSQTPASDGATYAALQSSSLDTLLPTVGAALVKVVPDASIKWILRLDETPPQGLVRLSFDGKKSRQAWVKRAGQGAGTPITGWENGAWNGTIPSSGSTNANPAATASATTASATTASATTATTASGTITVTAETPAPGETPAPVATAKP